MMKLMDVRYDFYTVALRFKAQYCRNGVWGGLAADFGPPEAIYQRLLSLGVNASELDVAKAMHKDWTETSWVGPSKCRECGCRGAPVVQLGDAPDYDSSTTEICRACLEKALTLFLPQGNQHD